MYLLLRARAVGYSFGVQVDGVGYVCRGKCRRTFSCAATSEGDTSASSASDGAANVPPPSGPLVGIKVLDLGQVVAGNFAGALFAYYGADVIKGRNRRCITVDLHNEEGRRVVRRLADGCDVLIENFRPGVMEKWGLGPADLKPDLVYTRISGYGQTGPKAQEPGYASVCEAYGGFRHINGYADRPPVRPNISLGDSLAGMHAVMGALMALLHRQRHAGAGQVVDAAISESMFNMLEGCVPEFAAAGAVRGPSGSSIAGVVPTGTFETRDGSYVIIGGNGDSIYTRLMRAIGHADLDGSVPGFRTNSERMQNEGRIMAAIADWVGCHTKEEVMAEMRAARVPCGPILSTADIMAEPQYNAREAFEKVGAPGVGGDAVTVPAIFPKLHGTPGGSRWLGPELGAHTEEVLAQELGMSAADIATLRDAKAI